MVTPLLMAMAGAGCYSEPAEEELLRLPGIRTAGATAAEEITTTAQALTSSRLSTGTYEVPGWDGRIYLRDGLWESAAQNAFAQLSDGLHAVGDFDGDGQTEAATVLTLGTGGLDLRVYLLGVGSSGAEIIQEGALLLGERVRVTGLSEVDHHVVIEMTTFGPGDDPCCPSREVRYRYRLRGGNWVRR